MKPNHYFFCLLFCLILTPEFLLMQAQGQNSIENIFSYTENPDWKIIKPGINLSSRELTHYLTPGPEDQWVWSDATWDEMGFLHNRFQLFHQGIKVEHAVFYTHERNGRVEKVNGFFPRVKTSGIEPVISEEAAFQAALAFLNDFAATSHRQPELLLADKDFIWETHDYRLVWKMEVLTTAPLGSQLVYIDAVDGSVVKSLNTLQTIDKPGVAETKYHGTRPIVTDSFENGYRLREFSRAVNGIEVKDLNNSTNLATAVDITDDDNNWNNINPQWDEYATDVHWGLEMTYDYFLQKHQRDSYDDGGGKLIAYIHFDVPASSTAFWNVSYAGFGDNNGLPHASLDVVGHEVTHGIIRNSAGNLVYIDEGGALNEGHADIFGKAVEHFVDSSNFSWLLGQKSGNPIRSLANPNAYGDPDTYKGGFWATGDADNGGAHTNANVLTHWFYLLSEGGNGVNDLGKPYHVNGIGIENAAKIVYRNLTNYLTPTSQFEDARQGLIWAAEDLFGKCSDEMIQTVNAWYAVGVGDSVRNGDLAVVSVEPFAPCVLGSAELITVTVQNFGCTDIPAGDLQMVYFIQDPPNTVVENILLPNGLTGLSSATLTFSTPINLTPAKDYTITARTLYIPDPDKTNDLSPALIVRSRFPVSEQTLTFESPEGTDSLSLLAGNEAEIQISAEAANGSGLGLLMEGGYGFNYRFVEAFPLWGGPAIDLFDFNPDFYSAACMCVDASQMTQLSLAFDLKQHYSNFFAPKFSAEFGNLRDSMMQRNANNLKVTANGLTLASFRPATQNQDTFVTHTLDLGNFAGQVFPLCFETKAVWRKADDFEGIGDRVFIDNIRLEGIFTDIDPEAQLPHFRIFPNPAENTLWIQSEEHALKPTQIHVWDMQGRKIRTAITAISPTQLSLNLLSLSPGVYTVKFLTPETVYAVKFVRK
ncbi:MAG: M4 family metallopeptidase [Bacteroidia bacterium]|nr:M4 family metallopeptidase [Bacteroidia bacterium]